MAPEKPNPNAAKPYRDNPRRLEGRSAAEVESELDQALIREGRWTKSVTRDGNGVRYLDGKGNSVLVNRGYPDGLQGGGDAVHRGSYVKNSRAASACRSRAIRRWGADMDNFPRARARSFEQDLLWSVLDEDAVPHILEMARDHWAVDAGTAWAALVEQAALGRLRAYRGTGPFTLVDLAQVPLDGAAGEHELFVEPTDATRARLAEIGDEIANA